MYRATEWKDHVTEFPNRRKLTNNEDGTVDVEKAQGAVIQQGTPQSATNFNNMETAIFESIGLNGLLAMRAKLQQEALKENEIIAIPITITGTGNLESVAIPTDKTRNRTAYNVMTEITAVNGGDAGDIIVSTKQANGFKVKYTGDAASVEVRLMVQGGMM